MFRMSYIAPSVGKHGSMHDYTHFRSKGIDDLTREGLCELEDKDNRELSPWDRVVLALQMPMGVRTEERSLLVGLNVSCSHENRNGSKRKEGKAGDESERASLKSNMTADGEIICENSVLEADVAA